MITNLMIPTAVPFDAHVQALTVGPLAWLGLGLVVAGAATVVTLAVREYFQRAAVGIPGAGTGREHDRLAA